MTKEERKNWQEEMFTLIKKWKKSGTNQEEFCQQHDISIHAFHYWQRKMRQSHSSPVPGFIPVETVPPTNVCNGEIQIQYPNGVLVILDKAVSISRLRALITAI
jgi:transposase-like protein